MTSLFSYEAGVSLGETVNPNLSLQLEEFTGIVGAEPYGFAEMPIVDAELQYGEWPVSIDRAPMISSILRSYQDDFYHRIHLVPRRIDLGNVAASQIVELEMWNAHFVSRTATAITGEETGLDLTGQPDPPLVFAPLESKIYDISVAEAGPSSIDVLLVWTFDNGELPELPVTGTRVSIIPFAALRDITRAWPGAPVFCRPKATSSGRACVERHDKRLIIVCT